jgi:SAM-dependent methyltransferase
MNPPLVCPRCRRVAGEKLVWQRLQAAAAGYECPACLAVYPVVDGVAIVLRDADGWLASEAGVVLARRDLPEAVLARVLAGAGEPLRRAAALEQSFIDPLASPLRSAVTERVAGLTGAILDVGCGAGLHGRSDVVGLEMSFPLARAFPGTGIVGDAADPPFEAESFDAVLLLNVLDSTRSPRLVLGHADALLRAGGTLIVSCPYAWNDAITEPAEQFDAATLLGTLRGEQNRLELPLDYAVEEVHDPVEWRVRAGARTVHLHHCQLVVARKR